MSSPFGGKLASLGVERGQKVKAGDPLFSLDFEEESFQKEQSVKKLNQAEALLNNMQKGMRPSELEVITASKEQAKSSLRLSELDLKRKRNLFKNKIISPETLDIAETTYKRDKSRLEEIMAQLETARQGARPDEILAAQSEIEALRVMVAKADWQIKEKKQAASKAATVFDTLYNVGEWVQPGRPVVSLLLDNEVKIRFFVPETKIAELKVGQAISFSCDACSSSMVGKISFISPKAEFTPPIIYSKEARSKLVFLVEAIPNEKSRQGLHPGQPVDVTLMDKGL
ncbi:MAG: HlyD family efflux transporter periplasmic adaptor subunit [Nitrospinae bacterium]|nr:HlyD family efflux transporter periplasmic adaptor subunit [Nitrospinota bacterium]